MIGYANEETIDYWTRGDLHGEWQLSDTDVDNMFHPFLLDNRTLKKEQLYLGSAMQLHMTSQVALEYNWKYRQEQARKMRVIPWDTNLLNAFHNLHFICYMADKVPNFDEDIHDGQHDYRIDVPGRQLWLLELVMKAATDCLRDDFIKKSKKDKNHDYRVTPMTAEMDDSVGFGLHITGECLFNIWVDFKPTVKEDGTFGCKYSVDLSAETWNGFNFPVYGKKASKNPLRQNMLAMAKYIKRELKRFSKMLDKAEFNQPEYALKLLNGKEIG